MKKIILMVLVLWINTGMAQSFNCRLDGQSFNLQLVPDEIFVKFAKPYTNADIQSEFRSDMMHLDLSDGTKSSSKFITLNDRYAIDQIKTLITTLNSSGDVVLASPLLSYEHTQVGMSTRIIVKLTDGVDESNLEQACEDNSLINNGELELMPGYYSITLPKERILDEITIASTLAAAGVVDFAEPDFVRFLKVSSFNDPLYSSQYALTKINATGAWGQMGASAGGVSTIKIAVLDCGVQSNHPDLLGNCVLGCDATYSSGSQAVQNTFGDPINFDALNFHGTACAGVIGAKANNSIGVVGLAYNCQIVSVRIGEVVTDPTTSEEYMLTDDNTIIYGFNYAALHADVISCSWGGGLPSSGITSAIHSAITAGRATKGCPVFFASGNDGSTVIPYPAYLADVICVGSTDATDHKSSFSNYSVNLDITAPGEGIATTDLTGADGANTTDDYVTTNGTSFSCPYAAGLMGLILSMNPSLTQPTARNIIESTCDPVGSYTYNSNPYYPNGIWSNELGYGRINANKAIQQVTAPITGPLITVLTPVPTCYNGSPTSAYFDIQISGGIPYDNMWNSSTNTGYKYYLVDYYDDPAHGTHSIYHLTPDTYFTQSTVSTVPLSLLKKVYLDLSGVTVFPFSTKIYVDVHSPGSGHNSYAITVTVNHAPDFNLTSPINLCQGQSLYLGSYETAGPFTTPGNVSTWTLGNYPNTNSITYSVPNPVIYNLTYSDHVSLTITSSNGCAATKLADVNVSNIQVSPAISTIQTCINSEFQIGPATVSGASGLTYQWYPTTGFITSTNVKNPMINAAALGAGLKNFILTITDVNGCSQNFTYPVNVNTVQSVVNITSNISLNPCPGHDVELTANIVGPYGIYSGENFTTGTLTWPAVMYSPIQGKITVHPYVNTTYYFNATDPNGCVASGSITVPVKNKYVFSANAGPDVYGCSPNLKTITGSASAGGPPYSYNWLPNNISGQNYAVPNTTATYTLEVTDANGCRAQDQVNVTGTPALSSGGVNPVIPHSALSGMVNTVFSPSNVNYIPASGGTPPYTYSWSPTQFFTNPNAYNPTTVPMNQSTQFLLTTTDANGCTASPATTPIVIIGGERSPLDGYPEYDVCGSSKTIAINGFVGGLTLLDGQYSKYYQKINNNSVTSQDPCMNYTGVNEMQYLLKPDIECLYAEEMAYSFTPAPLSQTGATLNTSNAVTATFASSVNSVVIHVNENLVLNWVSPYISTSKTYDINYTFPPKDQSRNNLLDLPNVLVYVGTDQLIHTLTWEYSVPYESFGNTPLWRWQERRIIPLNGWGNVRVEGWLATNSDNSVIYFKGTDQKVYDLIMPFSGSPSMYQLSSPVNVKSDIAYRQDGLYFIGSDNLVHRFNSSNVYDAAFAPIGGWGTLTALGSMALAANPSTNVAFLASDNHIYYLLQVSGSWYLNMVSTNASTGETIIDQQNGDIYFKNSSQQIETWNWNTSTNNYINGTTIVSTNDPGYSVDGYMIKDPTAARIFYKGNSGLIYNINKSGSTWYNWAFDYTSTNVAGDLRLAPDGRMFYINKDKWLHVYTWSAATNWVDSYVEFYSPKNVKACSNNYKMLLVPEDEDDVSTTDTTKQKDENFTVYPNPTNDVLNVDYSSTQNSKGKIIVSDITSRTVKSIDLGENETKTIIDLKMYQPGIYFISLYVDGKMKETKKVILQH